MKSSRRRPGHSQARPLQINQLRSATHGVACGPLSLIDRDRKLRIMSPSGKTKFADPVVGIFHNFWQRHDDWKGRMKGKAETDEI